MEFCLETVYLHFSSDLFLVQLNGLYSHEHCASNEVHRSELWNYSENIHVPAIRWQLTEIILKSPRP
jgi:hypothetical protein